MGRRSLTTSHGQLALAFDSYAVTNDAGVYLDCEKLSLSNKSHRPSAEIRIANAPFGFCWGISVMFSNGGVAYMPNEIDFKTGEFALTRTDALRRACDSIITWIERNVSSSTSREIAIVRKWVEGLCE